MDTKQFADKGIVSLGNLNRMAKVMRKAVNGEAITVAMIGGSITQGSLASVPENCYAYLVYKWWADKFKDSRVTYLNAGIGATTSQFALARAERDLLGTQPDFVIVEFGVNDKNTELFKETYEGLVRRILLWESEPAVLLLHNVQYNDGMNAQEIHEEIGYAYELPMVSVKNSLYPEVEFGRIPVRQITPDDLHPNDLGHKLVSELVINALEKIYVQILSGNYPSFYRVPEETVTPNRYFDSCRKDNRNAEPLLKGFTADFTPQEHITDIFRNGWSAVNAQDSLHFEVFCGILSVQYQKTVRRTAPVAKAVIDGDEEHAVILDANFEETWGDCLYLQDLLTEDEPKAHTLDITVIHAQEGGGPEFYLACVITANQALE